MRKADQESTASPASAPGQAPAAAAGQTDDVERPRALPTSAEPIGEPSAGTVPPVTPAEALRVIADASAALADSLELDDVLAAVGRLAVPRFADVCVLDLAAGSAGEPARRAVMASAFDAEREAMVRDYLARHPAGELDPERARRLADGEPVLLRDLDDAHYRITARTPEQLALLRRFHPRDVVVAPLRASGRAIGAMSLTSTTPHAPSAAEVALVQELAHRVAQAVLNAQLYAAARRSETRLALALEGAAQGFWDWDLAAGRLWVDRQLCAMLGRKPEEFREDPEAWTRFMHPDDLPRARAALLDHLAARTPAFESEHRMLHADGSWRWILARGRVMERDGAGAPLRLTGTHTDVTARRQAAESREILARTVEASADVVKIFDPDGRVRYVNPAGLRLLGAASLDAVRGLAAEELVVPEDRARVEQARRDLLEGPGTWRGDYRLRPFDGRPPVHIDAFGFTVRDPDTGEVAAVACVARDLTEHDAAARERERLAEQARHAQRIESLGVLAGGVAHDFNNLLTVILSTLDLVRADLPRSHRVQADIDVMRTAAMRASQLTRQLLAFSRRQVMESKLLDLNAVVTESERLLRRLVGERIALDVSLAPQPLHVRADPVQLEQVLVNLVVNARDAVAERPDRADGSVTVETAMTTLAPDAAARLGLPVGRYACLTVRDTGVGMDEATRQHAFEPFFTTKPLGRGTGLGLAMVYGIVTQSGGTVRVESAPGRGSTFRALLPWADEIVERAPTTESAAAPRGRETVLLVEDEAAVRGIARRILERAGYTVYEARHGADALLVWREQGGARGKIDVLLTDIRMPELDGRELAAALRRERPGLPVVYVSGYAEPEPSRDTRDARDARPARDGERFVAKPFVAPDLQRALRQVLDAAENAA
ncbi:PAS sensor protein [Gemmatirosa kalamazoonensis]|uniref:histidine kinase n=1 Tax=Gemmatirosa kalamazoonensis TaxID=861299 RepID=W0RBL5_9BACT|nr:PAS domain-containing protein [Gemmatirosa kalamazoonensis]AHG88499.1 PAS sensor protein [Gemmatirosa kalamazoonensis]